MAALIDVLVIGAGPTGLMLANQLARHGVRVRIIDRHAGPARETRALGVHARTLEIYAALGIAEQAIAEGAKATALDLWSQGRLAARVPLGDIGRDLSAFPYVLILGQDANERLLGERLREQGVDVEWRTELVALAQHADQVTASVRLPDGSSRNLEARWIAGCDGAHSAVRELNRIGYPGAPYEHVFFVADTEASGPMVEGELNIFFWRGGFHLFFPMRGERRWRVVGIVPEAFRSEPVDRGRVLDAVRREVGQALDFTACHWFSTYRIHHRRAERFRDGRAFLLGDAAHIHSPVGAQGMNTGLQDAYNLGWKLALVAKGQAGEALLDSYAIEREPVADRLLATTDRAFTFALSERGVSRLLRTRVLPRLVAFAMRSRRVRRLAFRTVSQIAIEYRASPLSLTLPGVPPNGPRAGERFPWLRTVWQRLDDRVFNLLVVGQPMPQGIDSERLRVHRVGDEVADRADLLSAAIAVPSFWLLRPDGHVGLCGTAVDRGAVERYFAEHLHVAM